jgi:hypothetical protein
VLLLLPGVPTVSACRGWCHWVCWSFLPLCGNLGVLAPAQAVPLTKPEHDRDAAGECQAIDRPPLAGRSVQEVGDETVGGAGTDAAPDSKEPYLQAVLRLPSKNSRNASPPGQIRPAVTAHSAILGFICIGDGGPLLPSSRCKAPQGGAHDPQPE